MELHERAEAINSRWVFRAYGFLTCISGFVLMGWGPMWLGVHWPGEPYGKAALIRVIGTIVMAGGFCAFGFGGVEQADARRHGLRWFAVGHTVVFVMMLMQQTAIWGPGLGEQAMLMVGVVTFVLWIAYVWEAAAEFDSESGEARESAAQVRSRYEQKIREAARQEERNRLARDLHDSIKQQIFVIQTAAATAQARLDEDPAGTKTAIEQVRESAREAMTEMQVMLDQLRAVPLENAGLIESLRKQCEALGFRTGARVEFELGNLPGNEEFAPGAHEAMLRVAQEALANAGRHARASHVKVSIDSRLEQIDLRVTDDGAGFDLNQQTNGQGISNMRARAEEFGGYVHLMSQPGGGTTVMFSIPRRVDFRPEAYRRKAVMTAVLLVASIPFLMWTGSTAMSMLSTVLLLLLVRCVVGYRRLRSSPLGLAR